jgi:hypothetical protein
LASASSPSPDTPRHLTANERLYVNAHAGRNRLSFCVLISIVAPAWLALTVVATTLSLYLAKDSALLAFALFVAVLLLGYLLSEVMPAIWRVCSTKPASPWAEPFTGALSLRTIDMPDVYATYPYIGSREAIFPRGWLDHIAEGEALRGYCYPVNARLVRPGTKLLVLTLENGLTVDREVDLGLLRLAGGGYWAAAAICGAIWGIGAGIPVLADIALPRIVSLWAPSAATLSLLVAALIGWLRNRAIWSRLDVSRRQSRGATRT